MTGETPCAGRHKSPPALSTTSACTSFLTIGHTYSDEKPQKVDETYHTRHRTICDKDIPEQHNVDGGDCECGEKEPAAKIKVFERVTEISEGTYLIVCENKKVIFNGSLATLDAVNNINSVEIDETSHRITYTEELEKQAFKITTYNKGYAIQSSNATNSYICRNEDKNGLDTSPTPVEMQIVINENGDADINTSGHTAHLRYNATKGQTRFRFFTSAQTAIQLYKLVEVAAESSTNPGGTGGDSGSGGGEETGDDTTILQYTLKFGSDYNDKSVQNYSSSWTVTSDNLTWTMVNFNNNQNKWDYVKGGADSTITSELLPKKITKIIIYITEKDTAKNVTLDISSSSSFDSIAETQTVSTAVGEVEITIDNPNINYYYRLSFDGTANKSITIEKVEFYGI